MWLLSSLQANIWLKFVGLIQQSAAVCRWLLHSLCELAWVNSRNDSESWWQHHKHCPCYIIYYISPWAHCRLVSTCFISWLHLVLRAGSRNRVQVSFLHQSTRSSVHLLLGHTLFICRHFCQRELACHPAYVTIGVARGGPGGTLPIPFPPQRLWRLDLGVFGTSFVRPPTQIPGYANICGQRSSSRYFYEWYRCLFQFFSW